MQTGLDVMTSRSLRAIGSLLRPCRPWLVVSCSSVLREDPRLPASAPRVALLALQDAFLSSGAHQPVDRYGPSVSRPTTTRCRSPPLHGARGAAGSRSSGPVARRLGREAARQGGPIQLGDRGDPRWGMEPRWPEPGRGSAPRAAPRARTRVVRVRRVLRVLRVLRVEERDLAGSLARPQRPRESRDEGDSLSPSVSSPRPLRPP